MKKLLVRVKVNPVVRALHAEAENDPKNVLIF
jgi:hypothetical protein